MSKLPQDWYWPLGALEYAEEIRDSFSEEAELIGVVTILWNRQEIALRRLFVELMPITRRKFVEAVWDRQLTHQARRDLLDLARTTVPMGKRKNGILLWVIEHTKTLADRRNELMHAEYVVHGRTDKLHAKVKSPRSTKPAKHQKLSVTDLETIVTDLTYIAQATEAAWCEFSERRLKKVIDSIKAVAEEISLPR